MTQDQIILYVAIALFISVFLISLAIGISRRAGGRSGNQGTAGMSMAMAGANGSGRTDGGPGKAADPAPPRAFLVGDPRPGPGNGSSANGTGPLPVGGIDDPATWTRVTAAEAARIARYRGSATVVLFEIDGLDRLVETLGAVAGERIVTATAGTIRAEARVTDTVARLGPHRFGVLLTETDEVAAINYTERVRAICDRWLQAGSVALRIAIGSAGLTAELGPAGAMRLAEERLDRERRPERETPASPVADTPARS